jgi:hypothetical protein
MRRVLVVLLFFINFNAWGNIGSVTDTPGTAGEIIRGKDKIAGAKGTGIMSNDVYATKNSSIGITFKDDTKVKITENSRLVIDDFVYDPKKSDAGKLALKVGLGTVRYASGQIAKNNPQQVAVKTPTATIAVRGTDFSMTVDETGQSLVVLVPSCKDEKEVKQFELDEQRCLVGKIEVSTQAGVVVLDKAFEATFVTSAAAMPTPPVIMNIVESRINNNLILVRPPEVAAAIKEQRKTQRDREIEEIEVEAQRRIAQRVKETNEAIEAARILAMAAAAGKTGCNVSTQVCVAWDKADAPDVQGRGKGIAFRINEDHYAEVKTQGYGSNTTIAIIHNDTAASELIGDGSPGGNSVYIKQNLGVLRR